MTLAHEKTLKYFDNDLTTTDCEYNSWYHLHWLKLRVEGVFLNHRRGHDRCNRLTPEQQKLCTMCNSTCETVEHFIKCNKYKTKHIWFETLEPQCLLSVEQKTGECHIISQIIKDRLMQRNLTIN